MERLLGIAMGCIGMSMDDFCRCTPSEFYEVYAAWGECRERQDHGAWERMRLQCLCSLQPYSKKKLSATDLMQFPWEEGSEERRAKSEEFSCQKGQRELSREEIMARYREAKKKIGLN